MQLSFGLTCRFQFASRGNHLWFLLSRTKDILAAYAANVRLRGVTTLEAR
jgi:hypothetical protein